MFPPPLATPAILSFLSLNHAIHGASWFFGLPSTSSLSMSTSLSIPNQESCEWDGEWERCQSLGRPQLDSVLTPSFRPGSIEGLWEGIFTVNSDFYPPLALTPELLSDNGVFYLPFPVYRVHRIRRAALRRTTADLDELSCGAASSDVEAPRIPPGVIRSLTSGPGARIAGTASGTITCWQRFAVVFSQRYSCKRGRHWTPRTRAREDKRPSLPTVRSAPKSGSVPGTVHSRHHYYRRGL